MIFNSLIVVLNVVIIASIGAPELYNDLIDNLVSKFINDVVKTKEDAVTGAGYIIAEYISDNANYRKWIRSYVYRNGILTTKVKKEHTDEKKVYEMYYGYSEKVNSIKAHRILAINRAEDEKVITVSIDVDNNEIISDALDFFTLNISAISSHLKSY